jgi:hypothetical protein
MGEFNGVVDHDAHYWPAIVAKPQQPALQAVAESLLASQALATIRHAAALIHLCENPSFNETSRTRWAPVEPIKPMHLLMRSVPAESKIRNER